MKKACKIRAHIERAIYITEVSDENGDFELETSAPCGFGKATIKNDHVIGNCSETNTKNCLFELDVNVPNIKDNKFNACSDTSFKYLSGVCWITATLDIISRTSFIRNVKPEIQSWILDAQRAPRAVRGSQTSLAIRTMPESVRDFLRNTDNTQGRKYFKTLRKRTFFIGQGGHADDLLIHILKVSGIPFELYEFDSFDKNDNDYDLRGRGADKMFGVNMQYAIFSFQNKIPTTVRDAMLWVTKNSTHRIKNSRPKIMMRIIGGLLTMSNHVMCFTVCTQKQGDFIRLCHDGEGLLLQDVASWELDKSFQSMQYVVEFMKK